MITEAMEGIGIILFLYLFACLMFSIFLNGTMEERQQEFKKGMNESFVFRVVVFFYAPISFLKRLF